MKIYIAVRYKGLENKSEIEALCTAVSAAEMEDFCFVRDIEHYQHTFDDPRELWKSIAEEISNRDALLIDVSDSPSGGRVVEAGIAYALGKPIFVVVKKGVVYKGLYDGISSVVIPFETLEDVTKALKTHKKTERITE